MPVELSTVFDEALQRIAPTETFAAQIRVARRPRRPGHRPTTGRSTRSGSRPASRSRWPRRWPSSARISCCPAWTACRRTPSCRCRRTRRSSRRSSSASTPSSAASWSGGSSPRRSPPPTSTASGTLVPLERPPDIPPLADWADRALGGGDDRRRALRDAAAQRAAAPLPARGRLRDQAERRRSGGAADLHRGDGAGRPVLRLRHPRRRDRRLVDRHRRAADGAAVRRRGRRGPRGRVARSRSSTPTPPARPASSASNPVRITIPATVLLRRSTREPIADRRPRLDLGHC